MEDVASRIHRESEGVRASHAREELVFEPEPLSGAIVPMEIQEKVHFSRVARAKESEVVIDTRKKDARRSGD